MAKCINYSLTMSMFLLRTGAIFKKKNVYYIVFTETNKIYYRGTIRVFNVNKINLETIFFILTDVSEKGSGDIHL